MPRHSALLPSRTFKETAQSMAERAKLLEFARFARGDPLLTAFEEGFACSMAQLGRTPTGPLPSEKQRAVMERIARKIGFGCEPEPPPAPPDEADFCEVEEVPDYEQWDDW